MYQSADLINSDNDRPNHLRDSWSFISGLSLDPERVLDLDRFVKSNPQD